jgi:hypothetical protein
MQCKAQQAARDDHERRDDDLLLEHVPRRKRNENADASKHYQ